MNKDIKHKKHVSLEKPAYGNFGRNEIAILGTPCGNIRKLAFEVIERLKSRYNIAYIDADHKAADADIAEDRGFDKNSSLTHGGTKHFTDKIHFKRMEWTGDLNPLQQKRHFIDQDLIIVNGNHFKGSTQIAVIDPKKSLEKKIEKLNNVQLFILRDEISGIPSFLKESIPDWENIPVFKYEEKEKIQAWFLDYLVSTKPPLNGLVLAGGKSTRMDSDKTVFDYHGMPQREFVWEMLAEFCDDVYMSCRDDQVHEIDEKYNPLPDQFTGLGPYGGILSAFRKNPNHAWMTVASDLPLLDRNTIDQLVDSRNVSKMATSFWDAKREFPEPLITIWEPRAYNELLYFLSLGYSCPRKALINSDVTLIDPNNSNSMMNVNNPEERMAAMDLIQRVIV